ncbi:hypothetical protein FIBSPDRAFT_945516 [Athelia psychrophila]|uniref:Uncharacterized protein n=1 Tax=Athelia psychrophila TaxID=1759441 RepID=A0A166TV22_9AGAM|nr:hypothetical protein FIBSPDRAFT_945516 [Fibularhizoctonia sp. CBS 109695]
MLFTTSITTTFSRPRPLNVCTGGLLTLEVADSSTEFLAEVFRALGQLLVDERIQEYRIAVGGGGVSAVKDAEMEKELRGADLPTTPPQSPTTSTLWSMLLSSLASSMNLSSVSPPFSPFAGV